MARTVAEWHKVHSNLTIGAKTPSPDLAQWPEAQASHMVWCRNMLRSLTRAMKRRNIPVPTYTTEGPHAQA